MNPSHLKEVENVMLSNRLPEIIYGAFPLMMNKQAQSRVRDDLMDASD